MARLARAEIFDPSEIVAVHLIGKTVRSCYLKVLPTGAMHLLVLYPARVTGELDTDNTEGTD